MRYLIRNKWISLRGSSYVRDENENNLYLVKGRFWTFTRKKFLQRLDGQPIYIIRNKFWKLFIYRAFIIDPQSNEIICTVRKKFWSLHDHYFIETPKYKNLEIRGNILGFDYHITLDGQEIGHVSRKISLRDSYVLDIDHPDAEFFIALVIAIDNITDERRANAASSSSRSSYSSSSSK